MKNSNFTNLPQELVLKGATLVDPINHNCYKSDIVINKGIIEYIGLNPKHSSSAQIVDLTGKHIAPGFFDMHVHFREPGNEQAEDLLSGANCAMAGGFTGVCMMPNTSPAIDNKEIMLELEAKIASHLVEVHAMPAVTKFRAGSELSDLKAMSEAGALAFTDDGSGLQKGEVMKQALIEASKYNRKIMVHAEDESFATGVMNESEIAIELGLPTISKESESVMIARDILIAKTVNAAVHFQHLSTKDGVELIRSAKKDGVKVSAETAPHYFTLTDESLRSLSPDFKMKPPLRGKEDKEAIISGLKDGTIEAIATDHAPHRKEAKDLGILRAPFGIIGLETAFSVSYKNLVLKGHLTLPELINRLSVGPRKILNLNFDLLKVGQYANLAVLNLNKNWIFDTSSSFSKSTNSPFKNEEMSGEVELVINRNIIWQKEQK